MEKENGIVHAGWDQWHNQCLKLEERIVELEDQASDAGNDCHRAEARLDTATKRIAELEEKRERLCLAIKDHNGMTKAAYEAGSAKALQAPTLEEAEVAGRDCAVNGANKNNCHFRLFASPALTAAWERGLASVPPGRRKEGEC